jgi:thiol:disulfide interchange protein DsbD
MNLESEPMMRHDLLFGGLCCLFLSSNLLAALPAAKFLPPQEAFQLTAQVSKKAITLTYQIADGYYLYKKELVASLPAPYDKQIKAAQLPPSVIHKDAYFGHVETYRKQVVIVLPLTSPLPNKGSIELKARSRGCADAGICYPPYTHKIPLLLDGKVSANSMLNDLLNKRGLNDAKCSGIAC